jgi:hypothetical protein
MKVNLCRFVILFFLSLYLFRPCSVFAQEDVPKIVVESKFKKNALYGTVGTGGTYFTATGYYERILAETRKKHYWTYLGRAGYGGYNEWEDKDSLIKAEGGAFAGEKNAHVEAFVGILYFVNGVKQGISPSGSMGFRFQKSNGHLIFRTGWGYPEAFYFGLGLAFLSQNIFN